MWSTPHGPCCMTPGDSAQRPRRGKISSAPSRPPCTSQALQRHGWGPALGLVPRVRPRAGGGSARSGFLHCCPTLPAQWSASAAMGWLTALLFLGTAVPHTLETWSLKMRRGSIRSPRLCSTCRVQPFFLGDVVGHVPCTPIGTRHHFQRPLQSTTTIRGQQGMSVMPCCWGCRAPHCPMGSALCSLLPWRKPPASPRSFTGVSEPVGAAFWRHTPVSHRF